VLVLPIDDPKIGNWLYDGLKMDANYINMAVKISSFWDKEFQVNGQLHLKKKLPVVSGEF